MPDVSRRTFMRGTAAVTGAAAVVTIGSTQGAVAETATTAGRRHGDLRDIKHIVVMMQENRSFDHYFGTMKGVRGFADRSTITLPGGDQVFRQPTSTPEKPATATQYPWHITDGKFTGSHQPPTSEVGAQNLGGTGHSWDDQHGAWWGGWMNGWYYWKGNAPTTLGHLTRADIPFHYALADAYTLGDGYHCSTMSATGPNRTYLWSGTVNADKKHGDTVAFNGGDELGKFLPWETYAETLHRAGVTWRVYQGSDNYGDNALQYFKTFAQYDPSQGGTAQPGNLWYDNGVAIVAEPYPAESRNGDNLAAAVRKDVLAGTLPQVSWIVTNQQYSEHPDGAPDDGAYYIKKVLEALNADPKVFNSTLVVINYDENDGYFDHVPPPIPPQGTEDEFYADPALAAYGITKPLPVGLGFRVPLFLVSPWTRGGWVTSEVSDHTSVIQFMEKWTTALGRPAICPNISAWRRKVCGDLTGAFDFTSPVYGLPELPDPGQPIGDDVSYSAVPTTNALPQQEPGVKPARPLPIQPSVDLVSVSGGEARLVLGNHGPHVRKASHFAVYDNAHPVVDIAQYPKGFPDQYTVDPGRSGVPASVTVQDGRYDITVVGANRFLRHFTGDQSTPGAHAEVRSVDHSGGRPRLTLQLVNHGAEALTFTVSSNHYDKAGPKTYHVRPHGTATHRTDPLAGTNGWYDLSVTVSGDSSWSRRYVGHLEDGRPSTTG